MAAYQLPQGTSSTGDCKIDDLIDYGTYYHVPTCEKKPSSCSCEEVFWIWACLPNQTKPVHSGKWMLFPSKQNVDETWNKIKTLLATKQLGGGSKVSTGGNKSHVICVYTNNFEDIKDVFRVLVALRRGRVQNSPIHYKTDEATFQGVYKTEEAAKNAGFSNAGAQIKKKGQKVSMYSSPNYVSAADGENIKLLQNNIGPECKTGLVAELNKSVNEEEKVVFYNPPLITPNTKPTSANKRKLANKQVQQHRK